MRIVVDSKQGAGYFEITQTEFALFQADWRQDNENRPDFQAMTLEQLLAYHWPEKDPQRANVDGTATLPPDGGGAGAVATRH